MKKIRICFEKQIQDDNNDVLNEGVRFYRDRERYKQCGSEKD